MLWAQAVAHAMAPRETTRLHLDLEVRMEPTRITCATPFYTQGVYPLAYARGSDQSRDRQGAVKELNVVIQGELVRMRAQPDGVGLVLALVVDERFEQLLGEDIALEQEGVVVLEAG